MGGHRGRPFVFSTQIRPLDPGGTISKTTDALSGFCPGSWWRPARADLLVATRTYDRGRDARAAAPLFVRQARWSRSSFARTSIERQGWLTIGVDAGNVAAFHCISRSRSGASKCSPCFLP
jgi:hypothetical protein